MITVHCYACKKELTEPGAILFGAPGDFGKENPEHPDACYKQHICVSCEVLVERFLLTLGPK